MKRNELIDRLNESGRVVLLDGGMGSLLAERGWTPPSLPEEMNLGQPGTVEDIHRSYCEAGADIIETNTFGGSALKLACRGLGKRTREINAAAARLARRSAGRDVLVAGSVGPLGDLLAPFGPLSFDDAYAAFRPQMEGLAQGGVDFFLIETMIDLREAKAAVLAAKDAAPDMAFVVSFTFDRNGRTVTGTPPEVAARWASLAGAAGVGANCGVGPEAYVDTVRTLFGNGDLPVFVYANAGLPGDAGYLSPVGYAQWGPLLAESGATVLGGCCGTTPAHIAALKAAVGGLPAKGPRPVAGTPLASRSRLVLTGPGYPVCVIGERINVSRPSPLRDEVGRGVWTALRNEAHRQTEAGAHVLDVNVGLPTIDQPAAMASAIAAVEQASPLPIAIDSDSRSVLETGLATVTGIPLINSFTAKEAVLRRGLELARRHGAAAVVLPIDEKGIPESEERRKAVIRDILRIADDTGYPRSGLLIDGLALAVGADHAGPAVTLRTISFLRDEGIASLLGLSNISHGMPARPLLNRTYLAMAVAAGLSAAILNPLDSAMMETLSASELLAGGDPGGTRYIAMSGAMSTTAAPEPSARKKAVAASERRDPSDRKALLASAILQGDRDQALATGQDMLDGGVPPLKLVSEGIIPALDEVGRQYDSGAFFLPQLIASAEAAQTVCDMAMVLVADSGRSTRGKILLATVEGDLHDLGKNVVGTVLRSHGFSVTDLGRDVPAAAVVDEARRGGYQIVGLSALMTSTMVAMAATTAELRRALPDTFVIVGGASVNDEFARSIGADGYAPDAVSSVRLVDALLTHGCGKNDKERS